MADNDKAVVPYDASKLMDAVRDRIKAEFVGLIPEETWKQMVKAEVDRFFQEQAAYNYGYGQERRALPSQFQAIVWKALEDDTKERLKKFLESPDWQGDWDGKGSRNAGEAVKKIMVEKSGEIISAVLANAMGAAIESMRSRI